MDKLLENNLEELDILYQKAIKTGNLYLSKGVWDDASSEYQKAIKLSSNNSEAYLGLLLVKHKAKCVDELCKHNISSKIFEELNFKRAKKIANSKVQESISSIEKAIKEKEEMDSYTKILEWIYIGRWKEVEPKIDYSNEKLKKLVHEAKYSWLKYQTKELDEFTASRKNELREIEELANSLNGYSNTKKYMDLIENTKERLKTKEAKDCSKFVLINRSKAVTSSNLIDIAVSYEIANAFISFYVFYSNEMKEKCLSEVNSMKSWLLINIDKYAEENIGPKANFLIKNIRNILGDSFFNRVDCSNEH